jgi:hypothetical protein
MTSTRVAMIDLVDDGNQTSRSAGTVPLAWYDRESYDAIKAIMTDGRAFASTYEEWEGYATKVEAFFVAKGVATVRVRVDPREFARWCAARGQRPDAKGRLAFGEWFVHSRVNGKSVR